MRVARPAEKVLAFASIYVAVVTELDERVDVADPGVQVALIDVALTITMSTDTKDMGVMLIEAPKADAQH